MNQKDTPVSPLYYKILVTLMLALSIIPMVEIVKVFLRKGKKEEKKPAKKA